MLCERSVICISPHTEHRCAVWPVGLLCIRTVAHWQSECVTHWSRAPSLPGGQSKFMFSSTTNLRPRCHDVRAAVKRRAASLYVTAPRLGKCRQNASELTTWKTRRCGVSCHLWVFEASTRWSLQVGFTLCLDLCYLLKPDKFSSH